MSRNVLIALAIIVVIVLTIIGAWYFVAGPAAHGPARDSITVGGPALEQSAYLYIARDQGYFADNGLDVTIKDDYPNGVVPIGEMADGKLDISVSAEYPVVVAILDGENISVISTIDRYQNEKIIGRKDRGILNVSDLKGKTIGLPRKTICEFFLGRFLDLNGMSLRDVTLVDVPTTQTVDAIANGTVDAIIYYQPYINAMETRLGDNATVWPAQSSQLLYGVLTSRNEWIESHQGALDRFMRSLTRAEEYASQHPAEAKAIVQKRMNVSDAYIDAIWPDHQLSLSLDQSLVIAMNDEARWAIANNLTAAKDLPDLNNHIYTRSLAAVKPEAVNIR